MEELAMTDKAQRDGIFNRLRASTDPYERQAIKWSDPERKDDGSWHTLFYVAYPKP